MRHRISLCGLLFFFHTVVMGSGFGAGTLVYTQAGLVLIEQVTIGSLVYCYDTQAVTTQKVLEKKISLEKSYLLITLETHETIVVSRLHTFYVPHADVWKQACELQVHDMVLHYDGTCATIQEIKHVQKPIVLYDLSVEHTHNYFVSRQGVLVHNVLPVFIGIGISFAVEGMAIEYIGTTVIIGAFGLVASIAALMSNRSHAPRNELFPHKDVFDEVSRHHGNVANTPQPPAQESAQYITVAQNNAMSINVSLDATQAIETLVQKNIASSTRELPAHEAAVHEESTIQQSVVAVEPENNPHDPDDNQNNCSRLDPSLNDVPIGCGGNIKTEPERPGCFLPVPQFPMHTGGHKVPEDISEKNPGCGGGVIELPIHTGNTNPPYRGPTVLFNQDVNVEIEKSAFKTPKDCTKEVEELLEQTQFREVTGGGSKIFEKNSNFEQALKDFASLNPTNVRPIDKGFLGYLIDGKTVNVRNKSSEKMATLQIYNPKNDKSIKIRYTIK